MGSDRRLLPVPFVPTPPRPFPARLHILLARESPRAVVIRRGPTRHTAVIGWDRKTDRFELGQWLYGRLYERRSDLSPDGRHLISFAMNGRWTSAVKGSWTAVSRAPWLKAEALYAKGDCWHGGGLFLDNQRFWLNDGYGHEAQRETPRLVRVSDYPWHEAYGGECPGVYFIRLQRDGWAMKHTHTAADGDTVTCFDKRVSGHWLLRKLAHASLTRRQGQGVYHDTHELHNERTGETVPMTGWEWAEVDGGRLVWAEAGRLHAGRLEAAGLRSQKVLHDFNAMTFERREAPY